MERIYLNSTEMSRTSATHFCTEASEIGLRPGAHPMVITAYLDGRDRVFTFTACKRDSEMEIEEWGYRTLDNLEPKLSLTVFND
jgi:hypothetical protein